MSDLKAVSLGIGIGAIATATLLLRRHAQPRPSSSATTTTTEAPAAVTYSRLMLPDDANPAGNVHGGTILKMIEAAGYICSQRHLQRRGETQDRFAVLATLRHMDFRVPMFVGEVSQLSARVVFAARSSIEVRVIVKSENLGTGVVRQTNCADLTYIVVRPSAATGTAAGTKKTSGIAWEVDPSFEVPPVLGLSLEEQRAGRDRAKALKARRQSADALNLDLPTDVKTLSVPNAALVQMMLPSDCTSTGIVFGGTIMKIMDSAAGCCAARFCKTNVVTVSIKSIVFLEPARLGDVLTIRAFGTFASSRSLEIRVVVEAESLRGRAAGKVRIASGLLNFVSLGPDGRPLKLPTMKATSAAEKDRWAEGQARYEAGKRARAAAREAKKKKKKSNTA